MSRDEEIKKAEIKYSDDTLFDGCDYVGQYAKQEAFIAGAKWADEHPNTEDIETVLAYTYKGLSWLAENVEFDMGTTRERALGCVETLQFLCNDVIMELRNKKIHASV